MRTKLIRTSIDEHMGYGAGSGDSERLEFECPCGKGKIIEEHDNIAGFRDHDVWIECSECHKKYDIDVSKGVRNWELKKK